MRRGVMYGLLAGAVWGFVFLGPCLLPDFSPLLLAAGRYLLYGLVSVVVALPNARRLLSKLTRADLVVLIWLALAGNIVYYILVAAAVQLVGVAPSSLIVGVLPLTITLAGRADHDAVPLRRLTLALLMIAAGIACINLDVFTASFATHGTIASRIASMLCAAGALVAWTWFAVANARYLRKSGHFDSNEWSIASGIVTGVLGALLWAGLLLVPSSAVGRPALDAERWQLFWALNLAIAIGCSWWGNALWNAAAKRLPLTLSGQLIVFETLFALVYGFIYAQRWPRALEWGAIMLLVAGVSWSVRQHASQPSRPSKSRHAIEEDAPISAH
ncbi:DMT family transporter [Mycetohabitans rhizoxinica]|uniref:DMT family transporter n=1 Tax=Mycetohabitans rhizoxinica TaxID=412963 RepID=UPI0030D1A738